MKREDDDYVLSLYELVGELAHQKSECFKHALLNEKENWKIFQAIFEVEDDKKHDAKKFEFLMEVLSFEETETESFSLRR